MGPILCVVHWQCASDLCSIAVAGDGDSSSASIDVQLLNHIPDEAKHVHLEIVVGHSACRVYQKQYVSLFPARSSCIGISNIQQHAIKLYRQPNLANFTRRPLGGYQLLR